MVERIPEILVILIKIIQCCAKVTEHIKNATIENVIYLSPKSQVEMIDVTNIKTLLRKLIYKIRQASFHSLTAGVKTYVQSKIDINKCRVQCY